MKYCLQPVIAESLEMSQTKVELPCSPATGSVTAGTPLGSDPAEPLAQTTLQERYQRAFKKGDMVELQGILHRWAEFVNVNVFDRDGQTALHQCCLDGNLELVKLLVKSGANIHLSNRDGWSALHIAAFGGHQDIALYLIANASNNRDLLDVPHSLKHHLDEL